MKLVYTNENSAMVGYALSILENEGIAVTEKNQYSAAGMAPPYNIAAEIWILNDEDFDKARLLIDSLSETEINQKQ